MFKNAASSFDRPPKVINTLHHSHSDSNCHRLYQHKKLEKRHSATSAIVSSRNSQQDTLRQLAQPNPNHPSFGHFTACSFNPVTHHILHDHEPHQPGQSNSAALGSSRAPKTRGLFRRVTRKVIEWIRGSIVPGLNKVTDWLFDWCLELYSNFVTNHLISFPLSVQSHFRNVPWITLFVYYRDFQPRNHSL